VAASPAFCLSYDNAGLRVRCANRLSIALGARPLHNLYQPSASPGIGGGAIPPFQDGQRMGAATGRRQMPNKKDRQKAVSLHDLRIVLHLKSEYARDQLQAVLDSMIDLFDQCLLMVDRLHQSTLASLSLDCHSQEISGALQERDIVLAEFATRLAIHFKNAIGPTVSLQDDVDRARTPWAASRPGVLNRCSRSK
jgi:hypothetical protein